MSDFVFGSLKLHAVIEKWPLIVPFRITGHTWEDIEVLTVSLEYGRHIGRGEGSSVYYRGETPISMLAQIEAVRSAIESGGSRESMNQLLPAGAARNALDCAMWDLEAKASNQSVYRLANVGQPEPILTTFTCGAAEPEQMAAAAIAYRDARAIKLKLTGETIDAERVKAVRAVRGEVWLSVDANQGYRRESLVRLLPTLVEARVALIEQPFPVGDEALLDGLRSPIPIAADESAQVSLDVASLVGRFQAVNIKLDKCGGLTEALAMARAARGCGLTPMVGSMLGTSLGMAPACVVGQLCQVADLDSPVLLKKDRDVTVVYENGAVRSPEHLWGGPHTR